MFQRLIASCRGRLIVAGLAALVAAAPAVAPAQSVTAFRQAIAETAALDDGLARFYREAAYRPVWNGADAASRARREALINAFAGAETHGLPTRRYDPQMVLDLLANVRNDRDRGRVEVELSRLFASFANDLHSGIVNPRAIDSEISRRVVRKDADVLLQAFLAADPEDFLRKLSPQTPEYTRLVRAKLGLERVIARGGWGAPVPGGKFEEGDRGSAIVALRNRMILMGYLPQVATTTFDSAMTLAVMAFQADHGLEQDGTVGGATLAAINTPPEDRLGSVLVAMERERWLPEERGDRHVLVNLTDFKARIIDKGEITFETRSVIGKATSGRRTPEFSDVMEHMIINPSWYVPRSIIVKEYLPVLQQDPSALSYLELTDASGQHADRAQGFAQYDDASFPFALRQPPGRSNALGLVKFMFPNPHNIYLHDTPSKSLFQRSVRDFSHGCIRLQDPFDFAYALLARQTSNPRTYFRSILDTGQETQVDLEQKIPVHLIYRTAYTSPRGKTQFRVDVYGRDAKILNALRAAGVSLAIS